METENNKTIELKLSQSEFSDAMVCNDQNLIHKVQMNQILEIVDAQFQKAKNYTPSTTPEDRKIVHNTISIFANRGVGKTTFLLSALKRIRDNYKKNVVCLRPLDPSIIDCKQHPFINIIAAIHQTVEESIKEDPWKKPSVDKDCLEEYKSIYKKLLKGLPFIDGIGNENIYQNWDDELFISMQGMERAEASNNLIDYFHAYVHKALKLLQAVCFVISFDDIDTQPQNVDVDYIDNIDNKISFDDINTGDEAADIDETIQPNEEETISLDNIDIQPQNDDVDYINNIDNKISFDDIDTGNETENIEETIQPNVEETISLDNIDTSFMDEVQNLPNIEEDTISLDDIETPDIRPDMELTENPDNNMISFEDIPEQDNTAPENSEDDINIADTTLPDNEENSSETIEQEIPDIENLTPDNFDDVNIEPYMDSLNPEDNIQTDSSIENISTIETNSDTVQNNTETGSFGQNLLENMTEENLNSIPIDELGLDETPTQNAEEITSDDLLSQIDDLLNSDDTTPQQPEQTQNEESIENVPDIDSLISDVNETELPETTPQQEPGYTETQEDNTNSDLDDIDALLNMSASDTGSDYQEENPSAEEDKLNVLYNDTDPASDSNIDNIETYDMQYDNPASQQQVPGQAKKKKKKSGNKTLITTAALITVLAGASAFVFLKPKSDSASDIEAAVPASSDIINTPEKSNSPENILETNAPDIDKSVTKKIQKTPQQVKELKNAPAAKKPISTDSYLEVKRLVWDVPDVLSYSPKIQNYLRTAGKSIKLSLSADLLLATEYAYSNQVKVNLTLNKNGSVQDAEIAASSGSTEIDNIVLQSVKDTLNVVKPPSSEISTPDFKLNLIIYF